MIRLRRQRGLDPELTVQMLPFYLQIRWLVVQIAFAEVVHFSWALVTALRKEVGFREELQSSISVFVVATSLGYFFARLASRFMGVSWIRIHRGLERAFDSRLGKLTLGCGAGLVAAPRLINELFAAEVVALVPFYCGAVVGTAFSFIVWVLGLPRENSKEKR